MEVLYELDFIFFSTTNEEKTIKIKEKKATKKIRHKYSQPIHYSTCANHMAYSKLYIESKL
jgi:hypothetical protein